MQNARNTGIAPTAGQRGIWFGQQLDPRSPAYNIGVYIDIPCLLDRELLELAIRRFMEESEAARCCVRQQNGELRLFVEPLDEWTLSYSDLCAERDPESAAIAWMHADMTEPRAMDRVPLSTFRLFRVAEDRCLLYLMTHHIATDAFGAAVFARRVAQIYTALLTRADPEAGALPPLSVLLEEDAEYHASADHAEDAEYWRARFADRPEPVSFTEESAPAAHRMHRRTVTLDASVTKGLRAIARLARSSWPRVITAAAAAYFHRMTGARDIVLGFPVSARLSGPSQNVPGMVSNVLPLRLSVTPDMSVLDLTRQAATEIKNVLKHQRYRHEELRHDLGITGSGRRLYGPTVNIMPFDYDLRFGDVPGAMHNLSNGPVDDLYMVFYGGRPGQSEKLRVDFDASPALYTEEQLSTLQDRFLDFLTALVASDPESPVGRMDLVSPRERERAVAGWNRTEVETAPTTLPELLRAQAARTPGARAVVFEDAEVSYAELQARVEALARRLVALGAGPERRVALVLPRSVELLVAVRAVLEAGAAYVPVDPSYPADRIAYMIADSAPVCVLTVSGVAEVLPDTAGIPRVLLDAPDDGPQDGTAPVDGAGSGLLPGHPAYVIYTSGTTGRPKGVAVTHEAIVNRLLWMEQALGVGAGDRVLQKTPVSFDVSVWELFLAHLTGATLVLARPEGHKDPAYLAELIQRHRVTVAHFVPSMLRVFAEEPQAARCTSLRAVVCSGEALPRELVERCHDTLPAAVHNLYGPTEAAVDVSSWQCARGVSGPVPIGRPVWNTRLYVLDSALRPAPSGTAGELYLSGVQLARGYLDRSALTAERFVADPYGPPGSRMYRTGDLARQRVDGVIEYLGRTDHQVKIRGFRVELGEVESVLAGHPAVGAATVVAREDRPGDQRMVAYVVRKQPTAPVEPVDLQAHLACVLPDHMVPSTFVFLEALPVTSNGKLDRGALPAPDLSAGSTGRGPRTTLEETLCELYAEILGRTQVGIDDSFFELGGHSLLAARLISRLRSLLGVELPIRTLFEAPTVAGLVPHLEQAALDGPGTRPRPPVSPMDRPERVPLSPAQRRLWFLHRLEGPSATYNVPLGLRLTGPLDREALEAALTDLARRHESLRTVFTQQDGEPCQVVRAAESVRIDLPLVETDGCRLAEELERGARRGFDLAQDLPLRGVLFRLDAQEHVLLVVVHHIAGDGSSGVPLARDLSRAYTARAAGSSPEWEPLPIQYTDYTLWQRQLLGDEDDPSSLGAEQLGFWRRQLHGLPEVLPLPADRPRPAETSHRGATLPFEIPAAVHEALGTLARSHGASVFMAVQAGLAALLTRLGAGTDIPLGTPIAGRTDQALEDLVGFFVNTVVLRTDTSGNPAFTELLERARDTALAAYAHQDYPFDRLVDALGAARSLSRHPLFQVSLTAPPATPLSDLAFPGLETGVVHPDAGVAKFDLEFHVSERYTDDGVPAGIAATLEYSTDLFDPDTAEAIAARLVRLLTAAASEPTTPIGRLDVLSEEERRRMSAEWRASEGDLPEIGLSEAFTAQAARNPREPAVAWDGGALTYAELAERSDQLAGRLTALGVLPEDHVALLMERSPELVVAMLGVLRAGAAYVPLDARSPAARIRSVLDQAEARLVLTDSTADTRMLPADVQILDLTATPSQADPRPPTAWPHPEQTAYVMYTSGTTGVPKGIATTHRGVLGLALDSRWRGPSPERILFHAPHAFDASTCEIWVPLLTGGTIVLPRPGEVVPAEIRRTVAEHGVTRLHLTAGLFRTVAEEDPGCLAGLREVFTGGDTIPPSAVCAVLAQVPGARVTAGYGPTETTMFATANTMTAHDAPGSTTPLGRPRDGLRMYLLDEHLQPVAPGVVGEMYVAGHGLARGYLGMSRLTAERFTADPYGPAGSRMYRTGDLFRRHADGTLEHVGRADGQVKIRGFRIEPMEIEVVLSDHPDVADSAVVVQPTAAGGKQLVGYLVPAPGRKPDIDGVRKHVGAALPEYMVPTVLITLDALPLTRNGKLDRQALPTPESTTRTEFRGPRNAREELLCRLFAEVLGVAQVGIDDNYFALGGDSITSIQLVNRARQAGAVFTPKDVFAHQTVAALAEACGESGEGAAPSHDTAGTGPVPLTPAMRSMVRRGGPVDGVQQSVLLHVPAELGEENLTTAVQALLDHHDILRLRLSRAGDGELNVLEAGAVDARALVRRVSVAALAPETLDAVLAADASAAAQRISPETGAVLQAVWFDPGPERPGLLFLTIHHMAVDGVSWRILLPDLAEAWHAARAGRPARLQPVATSFRRWAGHLHEQAQDPALLVQVPYWSALLQRREPPLGSRLLDPVRDTRATVRTLNRILPAETTGPLLGALPAAFHGTAPDILLAILATAVNHLQPRGDGLLLDLESHGRDEENCPFDLTRTVGWFTAVHPVRLDPGEVRPDDPAALTEAVKRVKEQLRAVPGSGVGYGLLCHLNPETTQLFADACKPQISFNYLGRATTPQDTHGWTLATEGSALTADAHPGTALAHALEVRAITIEGTDGPQLSVTLTWADGILSEQWVRGLADTWFQALGTLADAAGRPGVGGHTPSDFPLAGLHQAELEALLERYPDAEDVLSLAPLQEGILFHSLYDGGVSDVYTSRIRLDLEGP
ncbi:amino acid adenylation domain-containing protein, partial [Streptomyces sp. NPDC057426]|uniref:amino acid adenylation domain-containing protein n=1 Tax=Streptomyces sp. NPDC057426 TaxID=3346128 RepID=UPI00369F9BA3